MNKEELIKDLELHDWYFDYSDDFGVWKRGVTKEDEMIKRLRELPRNEALELIDLHVPDQYKPRYIIRLDDKWKEGVW